jgi:CDP-glycerol glycerophosphotransferase
MTGNPYAVFTYLLTHPEYQHLHHIWAMVDEGHEHPSLISHPRVTIVKYQGRDYVKFLATAKYLINDTSFPFYFHKRKEQIYANIWHGTPLKTMGMDIKQRGFADHKNIQRNFLFTDYLVSPNTYTYEKLLQSHDVYTLFNGAILDTGYPRVDLMFQADRDRIRKHLGITDTKKVILYAPTWRGSLGEEKNQSQKVLDDVEKIQNNCPDHIVLLKAHYYTAKFFEQHGLGHVLVPNTMDTNEVLSVVDLLITDYSSIFFEFLPTQNPIIFFAYDEREYQDARGTYIPMDKLPGPLCPTIDVVIDQVHRMDEMTNQYKQVYEQFKMKFCYHDDGQATKRFVAAVFKGESSDNLFKIATNKTKLLMYGGGFLNNGITASVINLLNLMDYEKYDVTLVDHGGNIRNPKKMQMQKVNKNVHHIFRFGTWNATLLDLYRHTIFLKTGKKEIAPVHMYRNEMERITGVSHFDIGIDFGGYSPFWAILFAYGNFKRKSIYLHSDMKQELDKKVNNKYPHRKNLQIIFSLYDHFDKVISVSESVHERNHKHIKGLIKNHERMDYVMNAIDYKQILSLSGMQERYAYEFGKELISVDFSKEEYPMPAPYEMNFITIGRLSPEKDHQKLIQSFYRLTEIYQNVRLYIVGEGVLGEELKRIVGQLNLEAKVIFTGQLQNPYPLLSKCDCFVLSSNYEGQAIVLLEALILGVPVITTDVPGPRSVVEGGYGLVVDNSGEGLLSGMHQFMNGDRLNKQAFDYKAYQEKALNMFYNKVCHVNQ